MTKREELEEARKLLGLGRRASIVQIKEAFRRLAKQVHPDGGGDEEMIKRLNRAYKVLLDYCESYPIPLEASRDEFEDYAERFFGNWFRGGR